MSVNATQAEPWVVLNGEALPASQARVSPLGAGFQLGQGVYTSFKIEGGRPVLFRAHQARLADDACALGLDSAGPERLLERVQLCAARNGAVTAAMKVVLFKDLEGTSELIQLRSPSPLEKTRERGCRLMTVKGPAAPASVARHKVCSYLPHLLARQDALAKGFDEALWLDGEGDALECAGANLFVVYRGELLTPALEQGLLPGVVRGELLGGGKEPDQVWSGLPREKAPDQVWSGLPWRAREARVTAPMLAEATEIFITNSLIGVLPVSALDGRELGVGAITFAKRAAELVRVAEAGGG